MMGNILKFVNFFWVIGVRFFKYILGFLRMFENFRRRLKFFNDGVIKKRFSYMDLRYVNYDMSIILLRFESFGLMRLIIYLR